MSVGSTITVTALRAPTLSLRGIRQAQGLSPVRQIISLPHQSAPRVVQEVTSGAVLT